MSNNNKVPQFSITAKNLLENIARYAANEAQRFFKGCFVKGGFTDSSFQPWTGRVSPLGGKKILYKDGNLMHSIRPTEQSTKRVVITSETEKSKIHNEGGVITVTAQMKKYWWAKYYEFAGKVKKTKKGKNSGSKANQTTNAKAEFCKRMALMKVGHQIKMPARQFLGESAVLMQQFDEQFKNEIENLNTN